MDIMELGAIGELVGGVAVIGSLALVGVREWALGNARSHPYADASGLPNVGLTSSMFE